MSDDVSRPDGGRAHQDQSAGTDDAGNRSAGVRSWLGIRYATAERFRPPVLVELDESAPTSAYGAAPFQTPPPVPPLGAEPDEDCHFLNVWAPEHVTDEPLPVYVSVYGGGFEHGAGSAWTQDGAVLAATGRVVVVSPSYRVGALGFVSLDAYGSPFEGAHNLGLQDLVTALAWVKENIRAFGGDPDQVCVVGESAGGFLTAALPAVRAADGLFARLSVHSAGASRIVPPQRAESMAADLVSDLGATDEPARLMGVPAADLVDAQSRIVARDIGIRNGPSPHALGVVDDSASLAPVLSEHPLESFASGRVAHVPILVSATQDEIALFRAAAQDTFDPDSLSDVVAEVTSWGVDDERARRLVDGFSATLGEGASPGEIRERILSDYVYRLPVVRLAQTHAASGGQAHLLLIGGADGLPAGHACDVPGLIGRHLPDASPAAVRRDDQLTDAVLDFITGDGPSWGCTEVDELRAHGIGDLREDATAQLRTVLEVWDGIPRP